MDSYVHVMVTRVRSCRDSLTLSFHRLVWPYAVTEHSFLITGLKSFFPRPVKFRDGENSSENIEIISSHVKILPFKNTE